MGSYSDADILKLLTRDRVERLQDRVARLRAAVANVPDRISWLAHQPLSIESDADGETTLIESLRGSDESASWFIATFTRPDGTCFAYASDVFTHVGDPTPVDMISFLLFDQHSRLAAWTLSHLWRGADLAASAASSLEGWEILPAAACARALLEGVAAFVVEGDELRAEWARFKKSGTPSFEDIASFRYEFEGILFQAQFGSRIPQLIVDKPAARRKNVLGFVQKLAKRVDVDVLELYDWLCDAVHPSFGFGTVFVATQGLHRTGATFAADLARRVDSAMTGAPKVEPTVAWAVVDAIVFSIDKLLEQFARMCWFTDDFGLTTGSTGRGVTPLLGAGLSASPSSGCPCGSGQSFEDCVHHWGGSTVPP